MTASVVVVVGGTVEVVAGASVVVLGATVVAGAAVVEVGATVEGDDDEADVDAARTDERGTLSAGEATTDLSTVAQDVARATTTTALVAIERERVSGRWLVRVVITSASLRRNSPDVATKLASNCCELAAQRFLSRDCHTSLGRWSREQAEGASKV
jgi:hypothetical protein